MSSSVIAIGGVTVSASGGHTGDLLAAINAIFTGANPPEEIDVAANAASLPAPPNDGQKHTLVIPTNYTGNLSIPSGYDYVVYAGAGTLTGGDANTAIVGDSINYIGSAGTVIGTGGAGNVVDSSAHAQVSFFAGTFNASLGGSGAQVFVDTGATANVTLHGINEGVILGTPGGTTVSGLGNATATTSGTNNVAVLGGINDTALVLTGTNTIFASSSGNVVGVQGASNNVIFMDGANGTVNESAGASTVFGTVNASGVQSVNATGGSVMWFPSGGTVGVDYNGSGSADATIGALFSAETATVSAGNGALVYSGAAGGLYQVGTGRFLDVNYGGVDTLNGGTTAGSAVVYGDSNANEIVSTQGPAANFLVPFGNNVTLNAMNSASPNTFLVVDPFGGGATTLIGSNAGHDTFAVFIDTTAHTGHTVDIQNWQAGDQMLLANLDPSSNGALNAADTNAINTFLAGGSGNSFTLSDGTQVEFTGAKPTTIGHL